MSEYNHLFINGMARSGGNLMCNMLNVNQDVMIASDPYVELWRSMRNAFIDKNASANLLRTFDPKSPIQDHYFTDERIQLMDVVLNSDIKVEFDLNNWPELLERTIARARLDAGDLIPYLSKLKGNTYREMIDNGFEIVAKARNGENKQWIGVKDSWTIEFLLPLARAYADARFIVLLRDPRAIISSMLGMKDKDPSQVAHTLSYARHWRKYATFCTYFSTLPEFENRLCVLSHEQILNAPEETAQMLCSFLDIEYSPAMLDTENYVDYATGKVWQGNSAYEQVTTGISVSRATRWMDRLAPEIIKMIDFVCGPEMKLCGYQVLHDDVWPGVEVLEYVIRNHNEYSKWRSDLGDPQKDFGFELFRKSLLALKVENLDSHLIRKSFLFEDIFMRLQDVCAGTQEPAFQLNPVQKN